jgi:non-specific serine/threonine protein kinase
MSDSEPTRQGTLYLYRFGAAEFDESRFELRVSGLAVDLERRPLEVLRILLHNAGEVVTKEELLDTVWEGRVTVENVLANAVAKLRKALGEANASFIVTKPRIGYRFDGKVERVATGRRLVSRLDLAADQAVSGRPNFRLARQLSSTAGSEVWLAIHDKTGEPRVYKFSTDGERLAALKREATLARVLRETLGERADMVRLIDWNFATEPFFLECEYGGQSMLEWADHDGRLAALAPGERLGLALRVIEAVAAAHDVGVLHKDLKPANILIDDDGTGGLRVRLTDFGSGRLMEPGRLDELGVTPMGLTRTRDATSDSSFGTPLYIAPEIIAGEAATAKSDVYALGVLLYQILAADLRRPLTTGWEDDIADELLVRDIARATAGNPAQRIASAAELAQRLQDLEQRRAERARVEETEKRALAAQAALDRARSRRPWVMAAGLVLLVGVTASSMLFLRAREAQHMAQEQAARAEATATFLRDIMLNADPREADAGYDATLRDALSRAADRIEARFAADPAMEVSIRETAGEIYTGLQDFRTAAEHRRRVATLLNRMLGPVHPRTLEARYRLGESLVNASAYAEAGEIIDAADADAAEAGAENDAVALAAARARGRLHLMQAQIEPAVAEYEEALMRLDRAAPDNARARHGLILDLAQGYVRIGRQDEAVELLEELQDSARFAEAGVPAARRATARLHYGAALLHAGRLSDAEPVLNQAIIELEEVFGPASTQLAEGKSVLGNLYAADGRWAEALPLISVVRETACATQGSEHLTCVMAGGNEGVILVQLGDAGSAIPKLVAARDVFERMMGPGTPGVQVMNYYLAQALLGAGDSGAAAALIEGLDPAQLAAGSPGEEWPARIAALRGWSMLLEGRHEDGAALLEQTIADMERDGMQDWIIAPFRAALGHGRL